MVNNISVIIDYCKLDHITYLIISVVKSYFKILKTDKDIIGKFLIKFNFMYHFLHLRNKKAYCQLIAVS